MSAKMHFCCTGCKGKESPRVHRLCDSASVWLAWGKWTGKKKRKKSFFSSDETRARCEQMASRGVNGPKSCNFSTLRWKVSTSFKPANVMLEGPTTCWQPPTPCRRLQLRVGEFRLRHGVGAANIVFESPTSCRRDLNEMETFHRRVESLHRPA